MSFTPEQLAQLKQIVVEAVKEAIGGGGNVVLPPVDEITLRADGAVQSSKLLSYRASYALSADAQKAGFAKWIPEWFFVEETLSRKELTDQQRLNIERNTNQARMTGGFLADYLFTGQSSVYTKPWFGTPYPLAAIPDAASLPGNNGAGVPAVTLETVPTLFDALYERFLKTGHVPLWKVQELTNPK